MKFPGLGFIAFGLAATTIMATPASAEPNHRPGGAHRPGPPHHGGGAHRPRPPHFRPPPHGGHRPKPPHHGGWHRQPVVRPGHGWHGKPAFHRWAKGQRFNYRYARYYRVVPNWRTYRLWAPPRGYHWVRSGNDAVLVALTSGIIAAVVANRIF